MFTYKADCIFCGDSHSSPEVTREECNRYESGELVQCVWPSWTEDEREVVCGNRTGMFICPTCWDNSL